MLHTVFKDEFKSLYRKINSSLEKSTTPAFGQTLLDTKARDQTFHIEGLARLLLRNKMTSKKQAKCLKKILKKIKALEDGLGKIDELVSLKKNITQLPQPKDFELLLKNQSSVVQDVAESTFGSKKWTHKQLKALRFLKQWSSKKTIKIIKLCLAQEVIELTKKTTDDLLPNLQNSSFSYDVMEDNFHEYRRGLRWLPIYIQTLEKEFTLSPYDLATASPVEKQILKKYKNNSFTQLPSQKASVCLDRFSYYMFSHSIATSGEIKDKIETYFKLKDLNIKTKINTQKAKKEMIANISDFLNSGASWRLYDSLTDKL